MNTNKNVAWGEVKFTAHDDDDDFILNSTAGYRQRTLSPRERLLPTESPPKKQKKRSNLKNPCNKKSKTVSTQTNFVAPAVVSPLKSLIYDDFPIGSIVGINGYDLDYGKFTTKKNAPMFYGLVENPQLHDDNDDLGLLKKDELIVKFVVSGEYEWYNKNAPNCLISNYKKNYWYCVTRLRSMLMVLIFSVAMMVQLSGFRRAVLGGRSKCSRTLVMDVAVRSVCITRTELP